MPRRRPSIDDDDDDLAPLRGGGRFLSREPEPPADPEKDLVQRIIGKVEGRLVTLVFDDVIVTINVLKMTTDDTCVALIYDAAQHDLKLKPGQKLTVISQEEHLPVVFAGGKVDLGELRLLSFIRGTTS